MIADSRDCAVGIVDVQGLERARRRADQRDSRALAIENWNQVGRRRTGLARVVQHLARARHPEELIEAARSARLNDLKAITEVAGSPAAGEVRRIPSTEGIVGKVRAAK